MPLTNPQRDAAAREFAQEVFVRLGNVANLTTTELQGAVTDLVAFIETNANAINNAIPQPVRSNLTTPQKRILLALATLKLAAT